MVAQGPLDAAGQSVDQVGSLVDGIGTLFNGLASFAAATPVVAGGFLGIVAFGVATMGLMHLSRNVDGFKGMALRTCLLGVAAFTGLTTFNMFYDPTSIAAGASTVAGTGASPQSAAAAMFMSTT